MRIWDKETVSSPNDSNELEDTDTDTPVWTFKKQIKVNTRSHFSASPNKP